MASAKKKRRRTVQAPDPTAEITCPFCGQVDRLYVDIGGGSHQVYSEDCAVCCRPRTVHVEPGPDGEVNVWVEREE
jgi:hypothetical protein